MTEARSPLDAALDLLIFAPVGFALTAAEEIPRLAAKGRAQMGCQVAMAKVVGQFAVAQGRKELSRRFAAATGPDQRAGPRPPGPQPGQPAAAAGSSFETGSEEISFDDLLARSEHEHPGADEPAVEAGRGENVGAGPTSAAGEPPPHPGGLAIPGYDSLAASQVVQRLAGLSADELAAVGAYERAHRARRTILTRVQQMQDR